MNVLIIGNGFDIAHDLPTSYVDFINFLRSSDVIRDLLLKLQNGETISPDLEGKYGQYLKNPKAADLSVIDRIVIIKNQNGWIYYFLHCHADIEGWIDLEREMLPVFRMMKWIIDHPDRIHEKKPARIGTVSSDGVFHDKTPYAESKYNISTKDNPVENIMEIWPTFFAHERQGARFEIRKDFYDPQYGLFKDKMIKALKEDLDQFIEAFYLYLLCFADNAGIDQKKQIEVLDIDSILTFNYTKTYLQYKNLLSVDEYHIHGSIDNLSSIVIGVNEVPNDPDNLFVEFTKYFQRLSKKSNPKYRILLQSVDLSLYIYGHSLDVTDIDIIKPFIDKANKVTIFFYNRTDYDQKIINLIKMFGHEKIEDWMYKGKIVLVETAS